MAANAVKPHHVKAEFCATRARYREGRELKAVKVYTINQESRYLLVQGVPSVGAHDDLLKMFALYGAIDEYRLLDEYPAEEFTDVMWIKFQKLPSARIAKRKMDNQSFYGGVLHVCFAPEYESVQDTREKMQERRKTIAARIRRLEAEDGQTKPSTSTMASSEEWSYRPQQTTTTTKQQQQDQQGPSHRVPPPHAYDAQHQQQQQHAPQQQQHHQQQHHQNQHHQNQHQQNQHQQQQQNQQHQHQHPSHVAQPPPPHAAHHPYPALPPPPQYSNTSRYPSAAMGGPEANTNSKHHDTSDSSQRQSETASKGSDGANEGKGEGIIIKEFQNRTVPKFLPRQIRDPTRKPLIKKHLLMKKKPLEVKKDGVNEELKMESIVLRDIQGPRLPEAEEERRSTFKMTETGSESVDQTVAAIRKRVHEFSVIAPPPQLKRKKKT